MTPEQLDREPPGTVYRIGVGSDGEGFAIKSDPDGSRLEWCDVRFERWMDSTEMCGDVGDIRFVSRPAPSLGQCDDGADLATRLNRRFHELLGVDDPCATGCTHVLVSPWTALGAANVLARQTDRDNSGGGRCPS